jgi:SAM-dependent methyltransferase
LEDGYRQRVLAEKGTYEDCQEVHDLPGIYHYWSDTHIRPKLEAFGFSNPDDMFAKYLLEQHARRPHEPLRFASIGAGNCDLEISLARKLVSQGRTDFVIDCLELNPAMLARARVAAAEAGVGRQIQLVEVDVNQWTPDREYHAVLANQSLHHILNLEGVFDGIGNCLMPGGSFVISDMIGRNGHLRWPEALRIVHEFWRSLPPSYRFNHQLQRFEEWYEDRDCSMVGFEGIRSQDILPLLVAGFHFRLFVGCGNVIDPFVGRSFGHNFDTNAAWDRAFIDRVHRRDEQEMLAGNIKPTHMLAVVGKDADAPACFHEPLTPAFCIRPVAACGPEAGAHFPQPDAYDWQAWPHAAQQELETACRRLAEVESRNRKLTEDAEAQVNEITVRTEWALGLDKELAERTAWAVSLNRELEQERELRLAASGRSLSARAPGWKAWWARAVSGK